MNLTDSDRQLELLGNFSSHKFAPGGSAANTAMWAAALGLDAGVTGFVGDDENGKRYMRALRDVGVKFSGIKVPGPTATSLIMVTPDGQRTMNTFLGASATSDYSEFSDPISSTYLFAELYLFDVDSAAEFIPKMFTESESCQTCALSLGDVGCVGRHRETVLALLDGTIDIIFGNADELCALFQVELEAAMVRVSELVELAFITQGADGATAITRRARFRSPASMVDAVVDSTGAGDAFAAAAIAGLKRGAPVAEILASANKYAGATLSAGGGSPVSAP